MHAPPRICRAMVEDRQGPPEFTARQRTRENAILAAGEQLMARFGRQGITARTLATALRISTATLTWHYTDLDALLGEILRRHLRTLAEAVGAVPQNDPNRQPLMRQAYITATRAAFGRMSDAHLLLTRDRHLLPEDVLAPIDSTLHSLAELIAGDLGDEALDLLDRPWLTAGRAEPILATMDATRTDPAPPVEPLNPPEPAATPHSLTATLSPNLPPGVAEALDRGDLTWLRPKGLGTAGLPFEAWDKATRDKWPRPPPTRQPAPQNQSS